MNDHVDSRMEIVDEQQGSFLKPDSTLVRHISIELRQCQQSNYQTFPQRNYVLKIAFNLIRFLP